MSNPITAAGDGAAFDLSKRVRYTNGLVLGVDEFNQEQLYFLGRHRDHARKLHGYGTACGLRVFSLESGEDAVVAVEPGSAVTPSGKTVHVGRTQCADVQDWVARHAEDLAELALPGALTLYVVLAHREHATDLVPIPSAACAPQEASSAPSRTVDDFELALVLEPPPAAERLSSSRFADLLSGLRVAAPGDPFDVAAFLDTVRGLADADPPSQTFELPADQAASLVRAALRVWITEVRPVLLARDAEAADRLLLARLTVDLADDGAGGWAVTGTVAVDEEERPLLVPTHLADESAIRFALAVAQVLAPPPQPLAAASKKAAPKKAAPKAKTKKAAPETAAVKKAAPEKTGRAPGRRTKKGPAGRGTES